MKAAEILVFLVCVNFARGQDAEISPTTEADQETTTEQRKTLTELVKEQTDVIKKIIAEHKTEHQEVPKKEFKDPALLKAEKEKNFIEELRKNCQHYFKLATSQSTLGTERPKATALPFGPPIKPQFLQYKPYYKPKPPKITNGNVLIFSQNPYEPIPNKNSKIDKYETAESTITEEAIDINENQATDNEAVDKPDEQKLKYVKLEPLVLQKTLLTNGKTVFYWYKKLPTTQSFVQVPDTPEMENVDSIAQPHNSNQNVPVPEQYLYYVDPQTGGILPNLQPQTTTTPPPPAGATQVRPQFFINPQTGMIYQNSPQQQFIYHNIDTTTTPAPEVTETPKPIIPHYTIDYSPTNAPASTVEAYRNEYRFVIPMVVSGNPDISKYPYGLDPYAYLPKKQQPGLMNIAVPYVPNYHMIQSLAIPKKYQQDEVTK